MTKSPLYLDWRYYCRSFSHPLITAHGVWAQREGIVLKLINSNGGTGYGEIAPLPDFGTETVAEAMTYLETVGHDIDKTSLQSVPRELCCVRSALECAWLQASGELSFPAEGKLPVSVLLSGDLPGMVRATVLGLEEGYLTFKVKITENRKANSSLIEALLNVLPMEASLRVDANGGLTFDSAMAFLEQFHDDPRFEFLEQPLPAIERASLRDLAPSFGHKLALDESIAGWESLLDHATDTHYGTLVVKPSLLGNINACLHTSDKLHKSMVFSSAMETRIGWSWTARIAAACHSTRAVGMGISGYFHNDGLGPNCTGPWLDLSLIQNDSFYDLWNRLSQNG